MVIEMDPQAKKIEELSELLNKANEKLKQLELDKQRAEAETEALLKSMPTTVANLDHIPQNKQINAINAAKRALKAIRKSQSILYNSANEGYLLRGICRVIVEEAGYMFAWIGYKVHDETKSIKPMAHFGHEKGYLDAINITWHDDVQGYGPTGTAVRTGKPAVCRDILTDTLYAPWRKEATERGYASSIGLPLINEDEVIGALNIYAEEPDAFDEDEVGLLIDLSHILSFGIKDLKIRKEIEHERERFFNESHELICIASPDGYFKKINPIFEKILGYTKDELLTRQIFSFIHPDDIENTIQEIQKQVEGVTTKDFINRYICKDGSLRIISWLAGPVLEGGMIYAVGRDVTEQMQIENELKISEERYKNMFNDTKAIMLLVDPISFFIVDANDAACAFYGYEREEITQKKITDINISQRDVIISSMAKAKSKVQNLFLFKHRLSNGDIRDVEVLSSPIQMKDKVLLFSIIQDITEKMKLEEEIRTINQNLQKRVEEEVAKNLAKDRLMLEQSKQVSMGELLVNISHHWRQPLCAVGVSIQDIKDAYQHGELNETYITQNVENAMDELQKLSETIDNFRSFYIKSKDMTEFTIANEINKAESLLSGYIKDKCIVIDKDLDESLVIQGYPNEFAHVILNILTNAKDKFVEKSITGGIIKLRLNKDITGKIIISISDNGGEIPEHIMSRLFQPYFTTKDKSQGTGMGLYMAKVIIEKNMKGTITVRNNDGWCEFRIEI